MIKLYVGNLPWSVNDAGLRDMFSEYGDVQSASVITDRETGRSRGFGFVEFASREDGEAAINNANGKSIDGRAIVVNEARPRTEGAGGGGRGGRGGFGGGGGGGRRGGW